jgi:hypothetical protein
MSIMQPFYAARGRASAGKTAGANGDGNGERRPTVRGACTATARHGPPACRGAVLRYNGNGERRRIRRQCRRLVRRRLRKKAFVAAWLQAATLRHSLLSTALLSKASRPGFAGTKRHREASRSHVPRTQVGWPSLRQAGLGATVTYSIVGSPRDRVPSVNPRLSTHRQPATMGCFCAKRLSTRSWSLGG